MTNKKVDLDTLHHIQKMVDGFYDKVREDDLIGPIFNQVIEDRWPEHLNKMYSFWQTILLDELTYRGRPFPPHMKLPVSQAHFIRWVELFKINLSENFEGPKTQEALYRAELMAKLFESKIEYHRAKGMEPLI